MSAARNTPHCYVCGVLLPGTCAVAHTVAGPRTVCYDGFTCAKRANGAPALSIVEAPK